MFDSPEWRLRSRLRPSRRLSWSVPLRSSVRFLLRTRVINSVMVLGLLLCADRRSLGLGCTLFSVVGRFGDRLLFGLDAFLVGRWLHFIVVDLVCLLHQLFEKDVFVFLGFADLQRVLVEVRFEHLGLFLMANRF